MEFEITPAHYTEAKQIMDYLITLRPEVRPLFDDIAPLVLVCIGQIMTQHKNNSEDAEQKTLNILHELVNKITPAFFDIQRESI